LEEAWKLNAPASQPGVSPASSHIRVGAAISIIQACPAIGTRKEKRQQTSEREERSSGQMEVWVAQNAALATVAMTQRTSIETVARTVSEAETQSHD
jgi:hypothetical protein